MRGKPRTYVVVLAGPGYGGNPGCHQWHRRGRAGTGPVRQPRYARSVARPTATNPYPDGRTQHAFHMPTTCQLPGTPSQEWSASHNAYHDAADDGFVSTPISGTGARVTSATRLGGCWGARGCRRSGL